MTQSSLGPDGRGRLPLGGLRATVLPQSVINESTGFGFDPPDASRHVGLWSKRPSAGDYQVGYGKPCAMPDFARAYQAIREVVPAAPPPDGQTGWR